MAAKGSRSRSKPITEPESGAGARREGEGTPATSPTPRAPGPKDRVHPVRRGNARRFRDVELKALEVIEKRGLNGKRVSVAAGISPSVVNRWQRGQRTITVATFARLCDALGLELVERPGGLKE